MPPASVADTNKKRCFHQLGRNKGDSKTTHTQSSLFCEADTKE